MTLLVENVYITSNNDPNPNPNPKHETIIPKNLTITLTLTSIIGSRTQEKYRAY